ncbi:hypothetical protein NHX12_025303 [Muraenolepis orangiensis]|uniref:Uncharacterized protein n=1 Tax=Muraenolepis orangiensis TaxID=630683 RepID=A0A9Q0EJ01_9TELE|nr:hypothetical protein NHX12_025303 [Muraenolepis orangiensis]
MALEASDKTVDQLKNKRTTAKVKFTRLANLLSKGADSMIKAELKEFKKFSADARRVLEDKDVYRTGLLSEGLEGLRWSLTSSRQLTLRRQSKTLG